MPQPFTGSRRVAIAAALATLTATLAAAVASAASAVPRPAGPAAGSAASPARTIAAVRLSRRPGTAAPGTAVRASDLVSARVFPAASIGVALVAVGEAQYPARTADGGRTWKLDGPALHVNAAQAPLAVDQVGAENARTYFAWGGGGQVVDATGDAGGHWWQALLGDAVIGVSADGGRLTAAVEDASSTGSTFQTYLYSSTDGGRHWRLDDSFGI